MLIAALKDGTSKGQEIAEQELFRMARLADKYKEFVS